MVNLTFLSSSRTRSASPVNWSVLVSSEFALTLSIAILSNEKLTLPTELVTALGKSIKFPS